MLKLRSFNRTTIAFSILLILIIGSLYLISFRINTTKKQIEISENFHLKLLSKSLEVELKNIATDLNLLVNNNELERFLDNPSKENYDAVSKEFKKFNEAKRLYDQIRFIDKNGKEIVRINYSKNQPAIVDKGDLQDKSWRYYFKKAIQLDKEQIYISALGLNVEHGNIEKPFKPIIRYCEPVFDSKGRKKGIVVLNYLGNNVLKKISKERHPDMFGNTILLNDGGYFLKSENNKEKDFGFMFPDKKDITFKKFYPDEWRLIHNNGEGKIISNNGLFVFIAISPFNLSDDMSFNYSNIRHKPSWKFISHVPKNLMDAKLNSIRTEVLSIDLFLFMIISAFLFIYSRISKQTKLQQKELEQSELKFHSIVDQAGDAMFISNMDATIIVINQQACKILGYSRDELIDKNLAEIDLLFIEKNHISTVWNKLKFGKPVTLETIHKRKDGSTFPVEVRESLIKIENTQYILDFVRDITERKESEEKLEQYLAALKDAQKLGRLGFYERNVNTNEGFWSDGLYRIFGFEPGEIPALQESFMELVYPDDLALVKNGIEESLKNHQQSDISHRIIRKDGEIRFMRAICRFVYDESGKPLLHRGTFTDITEQEKLKKVEKTLYQISQDSISTDYIFDFIKKVHSKINEFMDAANFGVALYHKETNEYSFPYYKNEKEVQEQLPRMKLEGGCIDYVRRTGKPLFADKKKFEELRKAGKIKIIGIRSSIWIGTPLLTSSGVIGVMAIQHYSNPNAYKPEDLELLSFISNNVAKVIERKQLTEAIKHNEEYFHKLYDFSPAGILIQNADGIILDVNKTYCRESGFSKNELIGKHISFVSQKQEMKKINKNINEILQGKILRQEINCVNKDGSFRPVKLLETKISLPDGSLGILSVADDISELKKVEYGLAEKENYMKSIFSDIHENIFIINADYEITDVNKKVLLDFNYLKKEVVGKHCYEISHKNDKPCNLCGEDCYLQEVFETGNPVNYRHIHFGKDGSEKHVDIMMSPLIDNNGKIIKVIEAMRDISDVVEAERKLHKSETKFRTLFENNLAGVFETSVDGEILICNNRFAEIYGYKNTGELIGKNASILYSTRESRKKFIDKLHKEKVLLAKEYKMIKKDGSTVWVLENSALLASGNIFGTNIDITKRKQVIKELRESEEKFKLLTESSPLGIIVHEDGKLKYVNKAAKLILDIDTADNQNIIEFVYPDYREIVRKRIETAIITGEAQPTIEEKFVTTKGNIIDAEVTVIPLTPGKNGAVQVVFSDITEKKRLQNEIKEYQINLEKKVEERTKKLAESEDKYRILAETSDALIAQMDKDGKLLYANSTLLNASKKSSSDILGKNHSEFLKGRHLNVTNKLKSLINKTLSDKKTQTMEMEVPWGGWVEWHFTPETSEAGKQKNVVIVGYDITQKKEAQRKLQIALEKEKSVNELKTQFISTVSHEFRTPLTSMFSSVELLERYRLKWDNDKIDHHFKGIKTSIERLTDMLEDVLQLSRIERGVIELNPTKINLLELCKSIVDNLKPLLLESHNIIFDYGLEEEKYLLDKKLLDPILYNLLSNAVKYSPKGGNINFMVSQENNWLKFVIRDEGLGIRKQDMIHIFNDFYRSDKVSHIKGTGLGLSIVQKYVEIHNGEITATSIFRKGSKFTVLIPI